MTSPITRYPLLILFLLLGCGDNSLIEWSKMGTPLASSIRDFAELDNQTSYVATTSGIFKSNNGGKKWEASGLNGKVIDKILITKSGTILAGVYRSGLYKSDDKGKNWTLIAFNKNIYIYSILESENRTLFLTASFISEGSSDKTPTGVFKSLDNGNTWKQTSLTKVDVLSLNEPKSGLLIASTKKETYISKDDGKNWKVGGIGLPDSIPISQIIHFNHSLYAALGDRQDESGIIRGGIYRSDDDGLTWFATDNGIDKKSPISSILLKDSLLYASAGFEQKNGHTGIYQSSDKGKTWKKSGLDGKTARFISKTSSGKLLVGTNGDALYISENVRERFKQIGSGIQNWETFRITGSKSDLYASGNGIWHYSSLNNRWNLIKETSSVDVALTKSGRLLIYENNQIFISPDKGLSWKKSITIPGDFAIFKVINDRLIVANITSNGSWYSTDEGLTWQKYKTNLSTRAATQTDKGTILLSGTAEAPFTLISKDRGETFAKVPGLDTLEIWDFAIVDNVIFAGTYAHGVFRSTDDGLNWTAANRGLRVDNEYVTITSITVVDSNAIVCTSLGKGVFISKNKGNSWEPYNTGITDENIWTSFYDPIRKIVYTASPSGIYQRRFTE